jgi:hypothetical protein
MNRRYTFIGLHSYRKVTRNFGILVLAVLVVALGFAAKHGQFDPPLHQGQFLAKSAKMEFCYCDHGDSVVINVTIPSFPVLQESGMVEKSPAKAAPSILPFRNIPLLV